jgi:hypothetical protein
LPCLPAVATVPAPLREPEVVLREVAAAFRVGDFNRTWDAWMAFFRHPGRNQLESGAFQDCFQFDCPDVGTLGNILGKAKAELDLLDGFCPSVVDQEIIEEAVSAEHEAGLRGMYARIARNGLQGSCEQWRSSQRSQLGEASVSIDPAPDAVPFAWFETTDGGRVPVADLLGGPALARALVDSGSSISKLYMTESEAGRRSDVLLTRHMVVTTGIYESEWAAIARLSRLSLGRSRHHDVRFDVQGVPSMGHPYPLRALLGMSTLLRYEAVCFAWDERRIYLGGLGPCAAGLEAYDAHLDGKLTMQVTVQARNGARFAAMFDTGAIHTKCSATFIEANGGELGFEFGDHPALAGRCVPDERVLFLDPNWTGDAQIHLCMNALLRFRAFGWQRSPFKLFLVPRDDAGSLAEA